MADGLSINPLLLNLKESPTLWINQRVRELRAEGQEVCHMGFGQSPFPVPDLMVQALRENAALNHYLPLRGLPALCAAISDYYHREFGYHYQADDVLVGPGSKELLFQLIYLLEGPLLIPAPSWVSYGPMARIRGKEIVCIPTKRENGYRLQSAELEAACRFCWSKQKLLILNNPNNPSGAVYHKEEIDELATVCERYNVIVLSDEIYSLVNFSGRKYESLATRCPERTIVTGGLSKVFSAGGWRLGFALVPEGMRETVRALLAMISETYSAVSAPIQAGAIPAYNNHNELRPYVELCSRIHGLAGRYLHRRFLEMGLNCPEPEGAFYLFPDFENYREALHSQGIANCEDLARTILEKTKVAFLPATDFYLPEDVLALRAASTDYDGSALLSWLRERGEPDARDLPTLFPSLTRGCDRLAAFLEEAGRR